MFIFIDLILIFLIVLVIITIKKYKKLLKHEIKVEKLLKDFDAKLKNEEFKNNEAEIEYLKILEFAHSGRI